jgi:hypothetical protein
MPDATRAPTKRAAAKPQRRHAGYGARVAVAMLPTRGIRRRASRRSHRGASNRPASQTKTIGRW